MFTCDELDQQSIRVSKSQNLLAKPFSGLFQRNVKRLGALPPEIHRTARNRKTRRHHLTGSARAAPSAKPRKKCQNCSRRPDSITEIKMIGTRIIEVDCAFHQ